MDSQDEPKYVFLFASMGVLGVHWGVHSPSCVSSLICWQTLCYHHCLAIVNDSTVIGVCYLFTVLLAIPVDLSSGFVVRCETPGPMMTLCFVDKSLGHFPKCLHHFLCP
jgi:hypothetical protein